MFYYAMNTESLCIGTNKTAPIKPNKLFFKPHPPGSQWRQRSTRSSRQGAEFLQWWWASAWTSTYCRRTSSPDDQTLDLPGQGTQTCRNRNLEQRDNTRCQRLLYSNQRWNNRSQDSNQQPHRWPWRRSSRGRRSSGWWWRCTWRGWRYGERWGS